jgi:transposase
VEPYVKTNKSDYIDAEAIAEAVGRSTMRFVPIKSDDQLDRYPASRLPSLTREYHGQDSM